MKKELEEIKQKITELGHKHLQSNMPIPLEDLHKYSTPWAKAEQAIDDLIKSLEYKKL